MRRRSRFIFRDLFALWVPVRCAGCGRSDGSPCQKCLTALSAAGSLPQRPPLDGVNALVRYDDTSRPFIADLKYRGDWTPARTFAPAMAAILDAVIGDSTSALTVTWAPTTADRVRQRGFDQAEVVATEVAIHAQCRVRRLLRRVPGQHQIGRNRSERASGIVFEAVESVAGQVVVVDDVITTGATLLAAAQELHRAGASSVVGLAIAATPPPSA